MFYKPDTTYEHLILKQDRFKKKFDLFLISAMKLLRSAFTISFPVAVMLMISVHAEAQEKDDVIVISTDVISPDDSLLIDRLIYTAQQFLITGQLDSAAFYTDRAINISRNLNYRQGKTTAYLLKAEIETRKQAFPLALRNYFSAVRELEWLGDSIGIANINTEIGKLYLNAGLYRKAIEYLRRSESIYNNSGMQDDLVAVKYSIASANLDIGQYDQALEEYLDLLKYYEEKDEISRVLRTLSNIILCYHKLHEYDLSMEYSRKALSVYENTSDNPGRLIALNNIGYNYKYLEDYDKSIQYFKDALDLMEKMPAADEFTKVITLINIAVVYQNTGDFENALEYLQQAIKLLEKKNDKPELANTYDLLSNVYFLSGDHHNALIYNENAIRLARETGDKIRLSKAYLTLSKIRTALYEYEEALQYYQQYLVLRDSLIMEERAVKRNYMMQELYVEQTTRDLEMIVAQDEIDDQAKRVLVLDTMQKRQQIELLHKTTELQEAALENQQLELDRQNQEKMLIEAERDALKKDKEIWGLKATELAQRDSIERIEHRQQLTVKENELLKKDNIIQEQAIKRISVRNKFLIGIVLLSMALLYLIYRSLRFTKKTNRQLTDQRNKIQQQKEAIQSQYKVIEKERAKSDKLLLNILPEETAAELKEKGMATPKHYEMVSVLFTDFVGFTKISENLSPQDIVKELDRYFLAFDRISDRHNMEKIKTIGDAYMSAGGIPVSNNSNPVDAVLAALEIKEYMDKMEAEKEAKGKKFWEVRIGIHTGPVVAGVVGKNKFAYDIWGDAVNTASRMESSGEPGRINISGTTFELVKDHFKCTYRGKISAKNKGEIDMYFVEGRRRKGV